VIATFLLTIKLENICIFIAERIPNTAKKAVYEDIMIYYRINFIEFSTARINSPKEYGSTTDPDSLPSEKGKVS